MQTSVFLAGLRRGAGFSVFIDGKKWGSLKGPKMSEEFHSLIEEYVQKNYQNAKEQ